MTRGLTWFLPDVAWPPQRGGSGRQSPGYFIPPMVAPGHGPGRPGLAVQHWVAEAVASYKLAGINGTKLENLLHRNFASAQIDLAIQDRFGHPVKPREWFLVPLHVLDEVVQRTLDGSITVLAYDPKTARQVKN